MKSLKNRMAGVLFAIGTIALLSWSAPLHATETITTTNPYQGITLINDVDPSSVSRPVSINVALINLSAPGISFEMSPATPAGGYATTLQTTLAYQQQVGAQMAINTDFFLPYPGAGPQQLVYEPRRSRRLERKHLLGLPKPCPVVCYREQRACNQHHPEQSGQHSHGSRQRHASAAERELI